MKRTSECETMTIRKFWLRALSGGLMAQLDWLASTMVGSALGESDHGERREDDEARKDHRK